ncbi:MAG: transporter substrate-binding domain-containing protein [Gammaproteobacteria bacterium]|nr:transporter substrate-binding domain-containing protein [Gammaproteobacteria bacterium]
MFRNLVLPAAGLALLLAGGCGRQTPDTLVVGMELADPPFEMTDEQGRPAGVSVDLARALGAYLGQQVVIENIPFDGLIVALKTGKIDLIISSMTATAERARSIDFSDPYLQTGLCLLVGAKENIQTIQDADQPGRTIVVKKGTTGQLYAVEHIRRAQVLVLDQESASVLEVVQGKADAFIYGQMNVLRYWQRNPATTRALLRPFQAEPWAIGVRKGNPERLRQVNAFLKDFRTRGGFGQLSDRWLKEQKETFQKLDIPFYF